MGGAVRKEERKDAVNIRTRMLGMEPPGRRERDRPKRKLIDVVKAGMWAVGGMEEDERT